MGFDELEVLARVLIAEDLLHLDEDGALLLGHFGRILLHDHDLLFDLRLFLLGLLDLLRPFWLDFAVHSLLQRASLLLRLCLVEVEALSAPPALPFLHLLSLLFQQLHQVSVLGFVVLLHELLVLLGGLSEGRGKLLASHVDESLPELLIRDVVDFGPLLEGLARSQALVLVNELLVIFGLSSEHDREAPALPHEPVVSAPVALVPAGRRSSSMSEPFHEAVSHAALLLLLLNELLDFEQVVVVVDLCLAALAEIEVRAFRALVANADDGTLEASLALEALMHESNRFSLGLLLVENLLLETGQQGFDALVH